MKCKKCRHNIRGANKIKVGSIWYHKRCPKEKKK
jgi:hypothetical protein